MRNIKLIIYGFLALVVTLVVMGALLFGAAGTWAYPRAWEWLALFAVLCMAVSIYFAYASPELFARRTQVTEPERTQAILMGGIRVLFMAGFVLAGLDHRFGWSHVPLWASWAADGVMVVTFVLISHVMLENAYAATVVRVEEGQHIIDTGLYASVRHPMYTAAVWMLLSFPVSLGSWWALLPFVVIDAGIVARLLNEETVLLRDLPGYAEYCRRVRWRLVPGVW